ncbi:clusterin [Anomaloglossus baeobatrachus]|uniref:clusterin n=1 Tax=Anomaloglossus baeobatrachus TaxID=238106 RepID=UPI003F4FA7D3
MESFALFLLPLVLLFGATEALVRSENLKHISEEGSKYITTQFQTAMNGVRKMKLLMDQTGQEHQDMLRSLEDTKRNKEDALKDALDSEQQLSDGQDTCNDTVLALWEECKPCLKHSCVRFYSKTCRSGSGLVGRQFEDLLNRSSPFSIFHNGDKVDALTRQDEQQHMELEDLEDGFSIVEDSVDELFQDSIKAFTHMKPFISNPFQGSFSSPGWNPFPLERLQFPFSKQTRRERSTQFEPFFPSSFESLFEAAKKIMERHNQLAQQASEGTGDSTDDKMVCRELRRNSAGCLRMKDKCEKCKEILALDCTRKDQLQEKLKEKFEDSIRLAEKMTKQYDDLLQKVHEKMLNATNALEDLSGQFSWVSKLANLTDNSNNGIFQVSTAYSSSGAEPSETTVTVILFDSDPFTFTVPGDIRIEDPKFAELVADEALKRFKKEVIEAA